MTKVIVADSLFPVFDSCIISSLESNGLCVGVFFFFFFLEILRPP